MVNKSKRHKTPTNSSAISNLKKKDMLLLWKEWKSRPLDPPEYENDLVISVNEVSHDTTIDMNDSIETVEAVETMASV